MPLLEDAMTILKLLDVVKYADIENMQKILGWDVVRFHQHVGYLLGMDCITNDGKTISMTGKGAAALFDHRQMENLLMKADKSEKEIKELIEHALDGMADNIDVRVTSMQPAGLFVQGEIHKSFCDGHHFVAVTDPKNPECVLFYQKGGQLEKKSA